MMRYFYCFFLLLFISCSKEKEFTCFSSSGKDISQTRKLESFIKIRSTSKIVLTIKQGVEQSVEVIAGKNIIHNVKTKVLNGELLIEDENTCNFVRGYKREIIVNVTTPYIYELINESVSSIYIKDFKLDSIYLKATSSGDVFLSGQFNQIKISSHGNGDVYLNGETNGLVIYMNGENYVRSYDLKVFDYLFIAQLSLGDCFINVNETDLINYSIQKSGNIRYRGQLKKAEGTIEPGAKGKFLSDN
jgi:Putative auto-transporter adhesin, head GIN domain